MADLAHDLRDGVRLCKLAELLTTDEGIMGKVRFPCNFRREGGQSLVIGGSSLVILEGKACNPL